MESKKCTSCGALMQKPEDFGKEKNGEASAEYCSRCWQDGTFTDWAVSANLEVSTE